MFSDLTWKKSFARRNGGGGGKGGGSAGAPWPLSPGLFGPDFSLKKTCFYFAFEMATKFSIS